MPQLRNNSAIVEAVKALPDLRDSQFRLIDIGASGGIDSFWRQWEPCLVADGFDPLVAEVERLNREEQNKRVVYHAAYLTCDGYRPIVENTDFWPHRTSSHRAMEAMRFNYQREAFNKGAPVVFSDRKLTLDAFCRDHNIDDIDFIKTDTDGYDYYSLLGATETMSRCGVMGVYVECTFYSVGQNNFANIDTLLRRRGFLLFDIEAWRYTHRALPGVFVSDIPAQTQTGPIQWCDALYMRQPDDGMSFLSAALADRRATKALKLAALYELWGYPDRAAALILDMQKRAAVPRGLDIEAMLDALVPANALGITRYRDYVARFDSDPRQFYPAQHRP